MSKITTKVIQYSKLKFHILCKSSATSMGQKTFLGLKTRDRHGQCLIHREISTEKGTGSLTGFSKFKSPNFKLWPCNTYSCFWPFYFSGSKHYFWFLRPSPLHSQWIFSFTQQWWSNISPSLNFMMTIFTTLYLTSCVGT